MAAPRGQQRAGGVSAIHVWLIVFVALWLLSTVLMVWLYTEQSGLTNQVEELRLSNDQLQEELRNGQSVRENLTELVVGTAEDGIDTVASKIGDLLVRIQEDDVVPDASAFDDPATGLLPTMTSLYEAYRGEHESLLAAGAEVDRLQSEAEGLAQERTEREQAFEEKEEELVAQVQDLETSLADDRAQRDAEVDAFESRLEGVRQQNSRDIQEQRTQIAALKQELAEYKSRYQELQAKFGELQITPEPLLTARQGDGRVLAAKPGEDVVYIDLGRKHRITRGMHFAVYPSDAGIPADGRAKARIEVARMFPETAECIVSELLGTGMIIEGDIINNPIYDKTRSLAFVVAGTFDFTGEGHSDAAGAEQIEALIHNWGGRVVDTVSARVDFVVLGDPPRRPSPVGELSSEALERQTAVRERYERYTTIAETAKALSVPILSKEVFLHFLGYSGRGSR